MENWVAVLMTTTMLIAILPPPREILMTEDDKGELVSIDRFVALMNEELRKEPSIKAACVLSILALGTT